MRLTEHAATGRAAAWSLDGSHLAFVSYRSGHAWVCSVELGQGRAARQVTETALGAEVPASQQEGLWLVGLACSGDVGGANAREIYPRMADGGEVVRLTSNGHGDTHPMWMPR